MMRYANPGLRRLAGGLLFVLGSAAGLSAQSPARPQILVGTDSVPASVLSLHLALAHNARDQRGCLASIDPAQLLRSPLTIQASLSGVNDSAGAMILPQVDFLVSAVAERMIRSLGHGRPGLPVGEPTLSWRSAGAYLRLVVSKRGTSIVIAPSGFGDELARMLAAAARDEMVGDNPVFFPEGAPGDSTVLWLNTMFPTITESRQARIIPVRKAFPIASLAFPIERPVRQTKEPDVAYPQAGPLAEGALEVRFVVDTSGRALPATASDEWPAGVPRLRGDAGTAYRRFLAKIAEGLPSGRYSPAAIGGCVVAAPVIQHHEFGVRNP